MSALEETLALHIRAAGLPEPVRELKFHPSRRWRFDFAWPEPEKVALEIEGAVWTGGRHTRGSGFVADCEKYNTATQMGWKVFRVTGGMVKSGEALQLIERALGVEKLLTD